MRCGGGFRLLAIAVFAAVLAALLPLWMMFWILCGIITWICLL